MHYTHDHRHMLLRFVKFAIFVGVIAPVGLQACSDDDNGGSTPHSCASRCLAVGTKCEYTTTDCDAVCASITEAELRCLETTPCDDAVAYQACLANVTPAPDTSVANNDTSPSSDITSSQGAAFSCAFDYGECQNSATEYCVLSRQGSINMSQQCFDKPTGCNSCDCIDAQAAWEATGSNNCTGAVVSCQQSDLVINVICQK